MEIPKIYKFTKEKYEPILVYLFILPESEFLYFFESLKNRVGLVKDYCGYEFSGEYITFWEDSSGVEISVKIRIQDFLYFIDPLISTLTENKEKIESIITEISSSTT